MRYGMVLDLKRCIGCYACQMSCKAENATPPDIWGAGQGLYHVFVFKPIIK